MSPDSDHPKPEHPPVTRFIFDAQVAKASQRDLELQANAIEARLSQIIERVQVGGTPILLPLIHMTKGDGEELDRLGKALQRVAEILPELAEIRRRLGIVQLAEDDPAWLASVFGDFDADVNAIINTPPGTDPPAPPPPAPPSEE